jgi:hypothetical protein
MARCCCSQSSSGSGSAGKVSLRYHSKAYKIGLGRAHKGRTIKLLIADQQIRVIDLHGQLIRELTLNPSHDYQPLKQPQAGYHHSRHQSPMSRDTTGCGGWDSNPHVLADNAF